MITENEFINATLMRFTYNSYLDAIDMLLEKGIYASKGEIVQEGLRYIFEKNGIKLIDF